MSPRGGGTSGAFAGLSPFAPLAAARVTHRLAGNAVSAPLAAASKHQRRPDPGPQASAGGAAADSQSGGASGLKASGPSGREGRERTPRRNAIVGRTVLALLSVVALLAAPAARAQLTAPELYKRVGFDQKLGQQLPLDLSFTDELGQTAPLRRFFGRRPVIMTFVYYECPMLCTMVLNGLVRCLKMTSLEAGKDFDIVAVSINPRDTPALGAAKKQTYVASYGHPESAAGWHFLTGDEASIEKLTAAAGFRYAYDASKDQYAHASGLLLLTPQGSISRLFYGIEYLPRDLRLGLVEASAGRLGSPVDQLILLCYHYDPINGRYGLVIMDVIRLAGLLTVAVLGVGLFVLHWRERTRLRS